MRPILPVLPALVLIALALSAPTYAGDRMEAARHAVHHHHGGTSYGMIMAERLEVQSLGGDPALVWDIEAFYGGDRDKLKFKSEGAYNFDADAFDEAELQFLLTRAIGPFMDVQFGLRQDLGDGPALTHLAIGLEGLLPHFIETDSTLFLSDDADLTASLEFEYELLFTQRLVLAPRIEVGLSAQPIPERHTGAGLTHAAVGARLRYEFKREIAPYVGIEWNRAVGETADFVRAEGEQAGTVSVLFGLRLWM